MSVDWSINLTGLLSFAVVIAGAIAAWVTTRLRVTELEKDVAKHATSQDTTNAATSARFTMLGERVEAIRAKGAQELADFKLEVAKDYAGHVAIRDMEQRVVKAIDEMGKRLEKLQDSRERTRP